jgi:hypothetical protein
LWYKRLVVLKIKDKHRKWPKPKCPTITLLES